MIEATIESIHRYGLPHTTVTTVTDLAGLSRGMVRRLFTSKEQMLVATMDALRADWVETTERIAGGEPLKEFEAAVRTMYAPQHLTAARSAAWIALSIEASNNDEMRMILEAGQKKWAEQFARPLRRAGVPDAHDIAAAVLALGDGLWLQHSRDPESMPRQRAEELAVKAALAMVPDDAGGGPNDRCHDHAVEGENESQARKCRR